MSPKSLGSLMVSLLAVCLVGGLLGGCTGTSGSTENSESITESQDSPVSSSVEEANSDEASPAVSPSSAASATTTASSDSDSQIPSSSGDTSGSSTTSANSSNPSSSATSASTSATSASSNASSSASNSKSSSSSSAAASALNLIIPSPDLLSQNKSDSATSANAASADAATSGTEFNYTGGYKGVLVANDSYEQFYEDTVEGSSPDQVVALAENGGTLIFADGKLVKLGDSASPDDARSYGFNAAALAVGAGSNLLLSGITCETSATAAPGIFATDLGHAYANNATVTTAGIGAALIKTTYGGLFVGNQINGQSTGENCPALLADGSDSQLSIANSTFATENSHSPIFRGSGSMEADNIMGSTGKSLLATLTNHGSVQLYRSRLSSTSNDSKTDDDDACAVMMYRPGETEATEAAKVSKFQAVDSVLTSTLNQGSLFYLTNTRSEVVLSNTQLEFDDSSTKLLIAEGDNEFDWGASGQNGASCNLAAYNQKLKGTVTVDTLSNVDMYLLNNSIWTGSAEIHTNNNGAASSDNLTVNIDSTSTWVVTKNSTVTSISMETGGKLVDTKGRSVKLVDSNGFTLVDGASPITIAVNGNFSMTVNPTAAAAIDEPSIDRTAFDETFAVETTIGSNGSSALTPDEQRVLDIIEAVKAWFARL